MDYAETLKKTDTWEGRAFAAIPLRPILSACLLFVVLIALYLLIVLVFRAPFLQEIHDDTFPIWEELDTVVILSILYAYIHASEIYLTRGTLSDVARLRKQIPDETIGNPIDTASQKISRRSRAATLCGMIIGLFYAFIFTGSGAVFFSDGKIQPFFGYAVLVFPLLFGRTIRAVVIGNPALALFTHQYGDKLHIDVFERKAYRPFVQIGMRSALRWLFLFAILTALMLDEGNNRTIFGELPMVYLLVVLSAIVATYEFVLPLLVARSFISREKDKENKWVIDAIRTERKLVRDGNGHSEGPRLSDLLAYKRELDAMSDWPVDSPDIGRFIVYLLIPVLSWFGGAGAQIMVESLIR